MKKMLLLLLVVSGGVIGYTYFLNAPPASAADLALVDLERQFDSANQSMMQASRSAGGSGLDTTSDIEAARTKVQRLQGELRELKPRLTTDASRKRANLLEEKFQAFREATD